MKKTTTNLIETFCLLFILKIGMLVLEVPGNSPILDYTYNFYVVSIK